MKTNLKVSVIGARIILVALLLWSAFYISLYFIFEANFRKEFAYVSQFLNRPGDLLVINVFNQDSSFLNPKKNKPYDITKLVNLDSNESIQMKGLGLFTYNNQNKYSANQYLFTTSPLIFNSRGYTKTSEITSWLGARVPFLQGFTDVTLFNIIIKRAKKVLIAKTRYLLLDRKMRNLSQVYPDRKLEGYLPYQPTFTQIDGDRGLYYVEGNWAASSKVKINKKLLVKVEGEKIKFERDLEPVMRSSEYWKLIGHSQNNLLFFQEKVGKSFKFHNIATGNNKIIVFNKAEDMENIDCLSLSLDPNDTKWVWTYRNSHFKTETVVLDLITKVVTPVKSKSIVVSGNSKSNSFITLSFPDKPKSVNYPVIYTQYVQLKSKLVEIQSVKHIINDLEYRNRYHFNTDFVQHYAKGDDQVFVMTDIFERGQIQKKTVIKGINATTLVPMIIRDATTPDDENDFPIHSLKASFKLKKNI